MSGRMVALSLGVVIIALVGCTPVQKGTVAGGAAGGAAGATIGHYATSAGGVPGAIIGFGLGSVAGAIASDYYYGNDIDEDALARAAAEADRLSKELSAKEAALQERDALLAKEKAQQQAVLEAYEKLRASAGDADVQISGDTGTVTYTLLSEVLFDSGRAELSSQGKKALKQAAASIRSNYPDAEIEVRGHTDNVPIRYSSFRSNWDLSCARAVAVVRYLVESEGFEAQKLLATGCGDTRPVASNATAEGRRKNRRAEIVVRPRKVQIAEGWSSGDR